jgi:hypothetical protein
MAQSGIHLVDHVLPSAPLRQWVVSFPWQLRELLAAKADVFSSVHRIFERVLLGWYRQRGRELGCRHPETGAVSVQQRFGSSMNANCHMHAAHLEHLPVSPELLADQCTVVYDVTDQPMPGWVVGADPEPPEEDAQGPPDEGFEGIDPPCPED